MNLPAPFKYYAFISYSHSDSDWAKWLQKELEYYKLPSSFNGRKDVPSSFRPVFRDEDELSGGHLQPQILKALSESEYLIVICSPNSAKSLYVNNEIKDFIEIGNSRNRDYTKRIFPFIVQGKPHQTKGSEFECFTPILNNLRDNEGNRIELIAGDVTATGRNHALIKIIAGTLYNKNIQFSDLWNRYEEYKIEEEKKKEQELIRYYKISSRFVAEKLKEPIKDGNIAFAAKALKHVVNDNTFHVYIEEIDRQIRNTVNAQYIKLVVPGDTYITENIFKYGDISPDSKTIVSLNHNYQICLWNENTSYLQESINLINIVGSQVDYICYVNNNVLAFVTKPFAKFDADNYFSKSHVTLRIGFIDIKSKELFSQYYFNIEDIRWINHTIIDGKVYIIIADDAKLHLFNSSNGNMTDLTIPIYDYKRFCYCNNHSIIYQTNDNLDKTTSISEWNAKTSNSRLIIKIGSVCDCSGMVNGLDGTVFIHIRSKIYLLNLDTEQLTMILDVEKLIVSIDFNPFLNALVILTGDSISMIKNNHGDWQIIYSHNRHNVLDNKVKWIGDGYGAVVFGNVEQGIEIYRFNNRVNSIELKLKKEDRVSFYRVYNNSIIIVTKMGIVIMKDMNSKREITRFDTHLNSIYDIALINNHIYITSATENTNDTKYLIRKAYEENYMDILSIWNLEGKLLSINESEDGDLEGGKFSSDLPLFITPTESETLQCWDFKEDSSTLLWEKHNCLGTVLKIPINSDYILFKAFDDCTLLVVDIHTGKNIATIDSESFPNDKFLVEDIKCADINLSKNIIVIAYNNGEMVTFDISTNKLIHESKLNLYITEIVFSSNGKYLYVATTEGIHLLSANSFVEIEKHSLLIPDTICLYNRCDTNTLIINGERSIQEIKFEPYDSLIDNFSNHFPNRPLNESEKNFLYLE